MQSSGLTSTPTTHLLLLFLPLTSLLTSITSTKHHLPLHPTPHLYPYLQIHRLFLHQLSYTSSTDLLFSLLLLYHTARPLERLLGTRKLTSLLFISYMFHAVVTPLLLTAVLRPLSWGRWNYIPAGATAVLFSLLAVWREEVPRLWKWKIVLAEPSPSSSSSSVRPTNTAGQENGWVVPLSSKSPTYALALQLALSQFPYTIPPALLGFVFGMAYQADLLPGWVGKWRVPGWVVGEAGRGRGGPERERYEGLRRRLEEEGDGDGMRRGDASGIGGEGGEARRRARPGVGNQIAEYFRGVF